MSGWSHNNESGWSCNMDVIRSLNESASDGD